MRALRNIAIIALLALVLAAAPGGGHLADAILAVLMIAFLVIIGVAGYVAYRQNRLSFLAMTDAQRNIVLVALGALVLMIAGADEMFDSGAGTLVWLGVVGLSVLALVRVVVEARSSY